MPCICSKVAKLLFSHRAREACLLTPRVRQGDIALNLQLAIDIMDRERDLSYCILSVFQLLRKGI